MWIFLTRRLRRWMLLVIALPTARLVVHRLALAAEQRDRSTRTARTLHHVDSAVTAVSRRSTRRATRLPGLVTRPATVKLKLRRRGHGEFAAAGPCGAYEYGTSQHLPGLMPRSLPDG
jgi:hypothetical protein